MAELLPDDEIYTAIGEEGFTRLVAAFYRQVPDDDILGPMYPKQDMQGAEERMREFLIFRFGGPPRYIEKRGHPRLRMRHAPFRIDQAARNRWMEIMNQALDEAESSGAAAKLFDKWFGPETPYKLERGFKIGPIAG